MKAFKFLTHPVILILSFLLILISGEHWGGFYLMYLLLALPHAGVHALLAVAGIAILVYSYLKFGRAKKYIIESLLNIIGVFCLVLSLYLFFHNDKSGYNRGTFEQVVPQFTFALFGLFTIGFIIYNIIPLPGNKKTNGNFSLKGM